MSDHYTYRVSWSDEDQEYVGTCAEFPSLSHLAPQRRDALAGIEDLVSAVLDDMRASGEPLPEPLAGKHYSGRFVTRVPPELHRKLVIEAAEAGVSLNRLVSLRLSIANDPYSPPRTGGLPSRGGRRRADREPEMA
jgi:predicted HicB family RNase H-like nuclease